MEHILATSYGKDSLACLGAIEELGWPLDRIVHAEVWATDTIPADPPPMVKFKAKADAIIKERWGIAVEHYHATNIDGVRADKVTYQDGFYHLLESGNHAGSIKGFPLQCGPWCQKLKLDPFDTIIGGRADIVRYLGIAADEQDRFDVLSTTQKSPLVKANWTKADCRRWCERNGLLSPIYTDSARGGCWFCHNQPVPQLRLLRKKYPEYWALMLKWDKDSPVPFHADGHTVHDFDRRFCAEDLNLIPTDHKFRWKMLTPSVYRACALDTLKQKIRRIYDMNNMTMTIKVEASDLVAAITQLAAAIHGPTEPQGAAEAAQPEMPAPVTPPLAPDTPQILGPAMPVASAPTYTLDQISKAGAALVDAGKMEPLLGLLAKYGVQAITQLAPDQYGAFATELRALGAQI